MYRFLRARKFNVEAAADMLQSEYCAHHEELASVAACAGPRLVKEAAWLSICQEVSCV